MKKVMLVVLIVAVAGFSSLRAQSTGDYRTITSGNWDTISVWQQFNGSNWLAATAPPTESAGIITISPGHTVVSDRNRTADQLVIAAGGTLHLAVFSGESQFLLHNGPGFDLISNGRLLIDGSAVLAEDTLTGGSQVEYKSDTLSHFGGIGPQFTFDGNVPQVIVGSGYMGEAIINNSENLEITATTSFQSIIFLNGKINVTGNGILVITQYGSKFAGQSNTRFIDGKVVGIVYEKNNSITFSLPTGKGNEYLPLEFTVTQDADVQTNFAFTINNSAPPARMLSPTLESVSSVRYYTVERGLSAANITDAKIKFSYNASDTVTDLTRLRIAKSGGDQWVDLGGRASGSHEGSIFSTVSFTTFGDFVLAQASNRVTGSADSLNYHFSARPGSYVDLTGATVAVLTADKATADAQDDGYSNGLPIGFTFNFNGINYDTINVNTNGYAAFSKFIPIIDSVSFDYWTNDLSAGPYSENNTRPVLAPLWSDHDLFADDGITYQTEGSPGSRVFTIQWDRVYWDLTVSGPDASISFQLKLFEASNIIQFHYKQLNGPVTPNAEGSIGITASGTGAGNFLSLNNTTNAPTASSSIDTYTLHLKPATGQIYQFSPIKIFYSKATGDLTNLSSWGSRPNGGGGQPGNFTAYDQQFNLVNRSGNVNLSTSAGTIEMGGQLNMGAGIDLLTAGKLIVKSYATHTGRIGVVPSNSTISGDVTVERYFTSLNNRAFRLITPSVVSNTSIFNNWQENGSAPPSNNPNGISYGTHITGSMAGANGFDATGTGQPSAFTYDEISATQKWDVLGNTNVNRLNAKTGYLIYVRGDRTPAHLQTRNSSSDAILRSTGTVLFGDVQFSNLQASGRFSLVTNPYVSPINWSSIYSDASVPDNSAHFENYYTYLDPKIGSRGGYVTVNTGGVRSIGNGATSTVEIQTGQAFFVKSKSGSGINNPTFTVKETHKGRSADLSVFKSTPTVQLGVHLLYRDETRERRIADGAIAIFNDNYSSGMDDGDAEKLENFDENIAFTRNKKILSIESRPLIISSDTLFLHVSKLKKQQYEWEFFPGNLVGPLLKANLVDNFLGINTPLSLAGSTTIKFSVSADASSAVANRFSIVFSRASTLPIEMSGLKGYRKGNGINIDWNTISETNISKYEVEKSVNGQQFSKIGSIDSKVSNTALNYYSWFDADPFAGVNFYRIRPVKHSGNQEYSTIIKVIFENGKPGITIYPNPIEGGVVNMNVTELAKGKYKLSVVNDAGQLIYSRHITHLGGTASYSFTLNAGLAGEVCQIQLQGNGQRISKQILVADK